MPTLPLDVSCLPIPEKYSNLTFSGNTDGKAPNLGVVVHVAAPPHVVFDNLTRLKDDGGEFVLLERGDDKSPWPVMSNGVRIFAFDTNDDIFSFDPNTPYKMTYRIVSSKVPFLFGVCATLEVVRGPTENTSVFMDTGIVHSLIPQCLLSAFFRKMVWGPILKRAEKEFASGTWKEKYKGPATPPPCDRQFA